MSNIAEISKVLMESFLLAGHGVNCEMNSDIRNNDKQLFNIVESLKSYERDYENLLADSKVSKDMSNILSLRKKLVTKFDLDKIRLSRYVGENINNLNDNFDRAVINILNLNPEKVYFSLTSSDSIDFRIYKNNFEIYLEIFYTNDDDGIECIYSIFKNDKKVCNNLGKFNAVFSTLNMEINPYQLTTEVNPYLLINEYKGNNVYAVIS